MRQPEPPDDLNVYAVRVASLASEAVDGIRRGMADGEAGREMTLEQYRSLAA